MGWLELEKLVKETKVNFPKGSRVRLVYMDDPQAPKSGTLGTVKGVDDIGSILVIGIMEVVSMSYKALTELN